jgi:hypothetical protein
MGIKPGDRAVRLGPDGCPGNSNSIRHGRLWECRCREDEMPRRKRIKDDEAEEAPQKKQKPSPETRRSARNIPREESPRPKDQTNGIATRGNASNLVKTEEPIVISDSSDLSDPPSEIDSPPPPKSAKPVPKGKKPVTKKTSQVKRPTSQVKNYAILSSNNAGGVRHQMGKNGEGCDTLC